MLSKDLNNYQYLDDLFEMLRIYEEEDFHFAHKINKTVRNFSSKQAKNKKIVIKERERFYALYKRSLLFDAEWDFDAFMLYIEFDREPRKKFYQPRRKVLRIVVQDLQDLYERKIKFLSISLPPRVGKTTLGIFYMAWLSLKHPELTNLMTGHSSILTNDMHKRVLKVLRDSQYLIKDVFPNRNIAKVSNDTTIIDIDEIHDYPTLTCRSIGGTLTGAVDVKGLLYVDDLIEDLEESLSPVRLDNKYNAYLNQAVDRKGDNVPELHIGTRWNINDVIGRIYKAHKDDPEYRFRVIPALDENNKSNFIYDYPEISFSTKYYLEMKKTFEDGGDLSTWYAKFQGNPRVRDGLVFDESKMNFFEEMPPGEYDVYSFCDVAWGGGDALSMPFAYKRIDNGEVYIKDIIYNKNGKDVTEPIVEARMIEHKPILTIFESNNGGIMYKEDVENHLREKNYRFNIDIFLTTGGKNSKGAKHAQILAHAPDIRRFYFLHSNKQSAEYRNAFEELTSYTENGNVKHDDVPDSLARLAKIILEGSGSYEIDDRPW